MMLRTARRFDPETQTVVFGDGMPFSRDCMAYGGFKEYVNCMFDFASRMNDMGVDNAEYALLTAICIFSGWWPFIFWRSVFPHLLGLEGFFTHDGLTHLLFSTSSPLVLEIFLNLEQNVISGGNELFSLSGSVTEAPFYIKLKCVFQPNSALWCTLDSRKWNYFHSLPLSFHTLSISCQLIITQIR